MHGSWCSFALGSLAPEHLMLLADLLLSLMTDLLCHRLAHLPADNQMLPWVCLCCLEDGPCPQQAALAIQG